MLVLRTREEEFCTKAFTAVKKLPFLESWRQKNQI
jgi:hypothetical protein